MNRSDGDARFPAPDPVEDDLVELGVFEEVDEVIGRMASNLNVWGRPRRRATTKESQQVPTVRHK